MQRQDGLLLQRKKYSLRFCTEAVSEKGSWNAERDRHLREIVIIYRKKSVR